MEKIKLEHWIIIGLCTGLFFYYSTYLFDLGEGRFAEGYEIPMTALIVTVLVAPIFVLFYFRKWKTRTFLVLLVAGLLLASFTGPKISVVLSLILTLFIPLLVVVKAKRA